MLFGSRLNKLGSSIKKAISEYAVLGKTPGYVADFVKNKYPGYSNFADAVTYSATTERTMTDSDGYIKFAPHNLALNSATPATQSITVVSGQSYTVECTGTGSITLSGAGTGTVTDGSPVEITASTASLTLTVSGSLDTMSTYRSDLGGMVNNPDRNDSYVPTTSSAVYLPRVGHHLYDGSSYVNRGLLCESSARTNEFEYSQDFTDAYWDKNNTPAGGLSFDGTGPDGQTNSAVKLIDGNTGGSKGVRVGATMTVSANTLYSFSVYVKADQLDDVLLYVANWGDAGGYFFNLTNGTFTEQNAGSATTYTATMQDVGNGWYRCALTWTTDTDTSIQPRIFVADGTSFSVPNDGTSSILIYGAQFEESDDSTAGIPTSLIPNYGASAGVTRAAETFTVPIAKLPWSGTAFSIAMNGRITYSDTADASEARFINWQADSNNRLFVNLNTSTTLRTGRVEFENKYLGTQVEAQTSETALSPGILQSYNIAMRNNGSDWQGAIDGTNTTEESITGIPDLSADNLLFGQLYSGTIDTLRVWDEDITSAGLTEATQ